MSLDYCWEKFFAATLTLAQSSRWPADRLAAAFEQIGRLKAGVSHEQMPTPELQARFDMLHDRMTSRGSFAESAAAMDEVEVHRAIEEVISIFNALAGALALQDHQQDQEQPRRLIRTS
jgi:hypothetical protein